MNANNRNFLLAILLASIALAMTISSGLGQWIGEASSPAWPSAVVARARTMFRPETNPYSVVNAAPVLLLALDAREAALGVVERFAANVEDDDSQRLRGVLRIALVSAAVGDLRCEARFQAAIAKVGAVDGLAPTMCKG